MEMRRLRLNFQLIREANTIMLSTTEILSKYKEFHEEYSSKLIDDYDTFVRSRVIEHFYRQTSLSANNIASLVNTTIENPGQACEPDFELESIGDNTKEVRVCPSIVDMDRVSLNVSKKPMKILLFFLPIAATAGVFAYLFSRKKQKIVDVCNGKID